MRTKEDPRQKNRVRPDKTFKKAFSDAFFEKRNTFEKKKKNEDCRSQNKSYSL